MLAARALSCRRGEHLVFAGVEFSLAPGAALLLRGTNGSGKSTLLRCLAGLLAPAAGALLWDGRPTADDSEAHHGRLHYLGHLDGLKPALSARENLRFWQSLSGSPDPALAARALERRRLALARLIASPAPLWLLDEPNAALDEESVGRLGTVLAQHRGGSGIVVVAAHGGFSLPGAVMLALDEFRPPPEADAPW